MNKLYCILVFIFLGHSVVFGQQKGKMQFESLQHHFGVIPEQGGVVSYTFVFKNSGKSPLKLENVVASCGCTTPIWTKNIVQAGDTGSVRAVFDPNNRPGYFSKTITVSGNGEPKSQVLTIEGNVKPKPKSILDEFPNAIGKTRFSAKTLHMGKVLTSPNATEKIVEIYNQSADTLKITTFEIPEFIKVKLPKVLLPNQKSSITVYYDAKQKNDLGYFTDKIVLVTNETENARKELIISANIEEYFPPMSDVEKAKAPKLSMDRLMHDFGGVRGLVSAEFIIENKGQTELQIRKVKSNCACTSTLIEKNTIQPGETTTLRVVFNPNGLKGFHQKTVEVFSNDPNNSSQVLVIKAKMAE